MRSIILNLAVSLDGFIEAEDGDFSWCFTDQDYGMTEFLVGVDAIFFGRKSYEALLKMGENPFASKRSYVFSRSLQAAPEGAELVSGEMEKAVRRIRSEPGKNIWLFGGAELVSAMMNADLVDELQIAVHPLLLGSGKPLFQNLDARKWLHHTETRNYSSGLVQLFYRRKK